MSGRFSIVLSGGGCKAFWANGALGALDDVLPPVDHFAGVSAGAAFALAHVAGRFDDTFEHFLTVVEANRRNFYPGRVLRLQRPFPHDQIYRDAMGCFLDERGFACIREGTPVHILQSYVDSGEPLLRTTWSAIQAFADRRRRGVLQGPEELPPGVGVQVVCSREASDVDQLLDWTLRSSTIWPVTKIQREAGRRYLDGGLIDYIPIRALPEHARGAGTKVVCLVSHHVSVPAKPVSRPDGTQVLYLAAREPLPVKVWDYTSPERVIAAFELGRRDGAALREKVSAFVEA